MLEITTPCKRRLLVGVCVLLAQHPSPVALPSFSSKCFLHGPGRSVDLPSVPLGQSNPADLRTRMTAQALTVDRNCCVNASVDFISLLQYRTKALPETPLFSIPASVQCCLNSSWFCSWNNTKMARYCSFKLFHTNWPGFLDGDKHFVFSIWFSLLLVRKAAYFPSPILLCNRRVTKETSINTISGTSSKQITFENWNEKEKSTAENGVNMKMSSSCYWILGCINLKTVVVLAFVEDILLQSCLPRPRLQPSWWILSRSQPAGARFNQLVSKKYSLWKERN